MTLRPPPPPKSPRALDAEERALAKSLPRLHGRTAPGPDLDASILAAAQAAVHPARAARAETRSETRPRLRWIAPASLAASMVLAVGMVWQLRPLPALESAQPAVQSDGVDIAAVRMIEPAPYDKPTPVMKSIPAPARSTTPARQLESLPVINDQEGTPSPEAQRVQSPVPVPSPPVLPVSTPHPAPPAPPPPPVAGIAAEAPPRVGSAAKPSAASSANTLDSQTYDRAMRARSTAPATAADANSDVFAQEAPPASADKAGMIERTQQAARKAAAPAPAMPEVRKETRMASDAGFVDDPDEDVPPATVNSPAVRDAWLHRIGELLEQGKLQEAKASLAEFRRRYPSAVLPPRLRALEIES